MLSHRKSYQRASVISDNVSVVQVTLKDSTDPDLFPGLWYEVRKKVGDIRGDLPVALQGPVFDDEYSDVYASLLMVTAEGLPQTELLPYAERLRQRLLAIPDIDKVDLVGERPRRIFVEISYRKLATLGIPPTAIFLALRAQNEVTPAGSIDTPTERIAVRVDGAFSNEAAVADTPIAVNGRTFQLGDIATVTRGYEDPPGFIARWNGTEALVLAVRMRAGANGLALGDEINDAVEEVQAAVPFGVDSVSRPIRPPSSKAPSTSSSKRSWSPSAWCC